VETASILLDRYGPLMSGEDLARLLGRSLEGMRFTARGSSELAQRLRAARVKIGRRVRYRTASVALLIDQGASSEPSPRMLALPESPR
jgi:hypothetical protein